MLGSLFLGFIPPLLVQILIWFSISGNINSPYIARGERFFWNSPHLLGVLVDAPNGLFLVSPIILLSVGGLIYSFHKFLLSEIGILLFVLQTYVLGAWEYWQGGAAYGGRMFISLMPFFAFGLAVVLNNIKNKYLHIFLVLVFTIFNMFGILLFLVTNQ
jgi:hypothetical protein